VGQASCQVSVIVPTHNRCALVRGQIDALLDQTTKDYEVIYVNDGSTDDTPRLLADYAGHHPDRLRWTTAAFGAPGPSRNLGAAMARGEFLLFADDDVIVGRDWVAAMLARYKAHACEALSGGFEPFALDTPAERYLDCRMRARFGARPRYVRAAPMMSFLIPADLFRRVGGFLNEPIAAAEDWEFCERLRIHGARIFYDPAVKVTHRYQKDEAAVLERIRATAALGVYTWSRNHRTTALYTAYSALRFAASPLWLWRRYPADLIGLAFRMEAHFCRARVAAYLRQVKP